MTTNVNIESFESFTDGSGASGVVSVYGYRFAVICGSADSVTVSPLNSTQYHENGRAKGMRKTAASTARAWFESRLEQLGSDWRRLNQDMYA
jgi:hypothetical protein